MRYFFDFLALVFILGNAFLGYKHGIFSRLVAFVGLFGGIAGATFATASVTRGIRGDTPSGGDIFTAAWTYFVIIGMLVFMVEVLAWLYQDKFENTFSLIFNKTLGILAGLFLGVCEMGVVCLVLLSLAQTPASTSQGLVLPATRTIAADELNASLLGSKLTNTVPFIKTVFKPSLPSDLPQYLSDATTKVAKKAQ